MKMTTEEAFVKVLQMHGIEHAFGIIGSAFMPISDMEGYDSPEAFVEAWLDHASRSPEWKALEAASRQLSLF